MDKLEGYIAKDLMAEIDGKFRTLRDRHSRAIAGLSMGGYGALKIALRYPGDFAFAGSLSGALNAPQELGDKRPELRDQLRKVFGLPGGTVRGDNNLFSLVQSPNTKDPLYFYLSCGSGDHETEGGGHATLGTDRFLIYRGQPHVIIIAGIRNSMIVSRCASPAQNTRYAQALTAPSS